MARKPRKNTGFQRITEVLRHAETQPSFTLRRTRVFVNAEHHVATLDGVPVRFIPWTRDAQRPAMWICPACGASSQIIFETPGKTWACKSCRDDRRGEPADRIPPPTFDLPADTLTLEERRIELTRLLADERRRYRQLQRKFS